MGLLNVDKKVDLLSSNDPKPIKQLCMRFAWSFFSGLVFALPGRQLSFIRVFLLRLFGATIGKKVLICSGVHVWFPWELKIGDFSAIGRSVEIYNYGFVEIGSNTVISQYSYLCTASHDYLSRTMNFYSKPIIIGQYVWIAAHAMIMPGVHVGDGSVIGARSVLTKSSDPWHVYSGLPAKKIKPRNLYN